MARCPVTAVATAVATAAVMVAAMVAVTVVMAVVMVAATAVMAVAMVVVTAVVTATKYNRRNLQRRRSRQSEDAAYRAVSKSGGSLLSSLIEPAHNCRLMILSAVVISFAVHSERVGRG